MTAINRDEWLRALEIAGRPSVDDQNAVTILEFCELLGITQGQARHRLDLLVKQELAIRTTKQAVSTNGRTQFFVAYLLLKDKQKV